MVKTLFVWKMRLVKGNNNIMDSLNNNLKSAKITFFQAREKRRKGCFVRTAHNLYQDIETKDFWKINKESGKVERVIDVDDQGFAKEQ